MTTNLDTLVATAMGWTRHRKGCMHAAEGRTFFEIIARGSVYVHKWEDDIGPIRTLFSPSTNISDAHMFRNKVLAEHQDWFVMTGYKHGDNHTIHVLADGNAHEIGVAEEAVEPLALCLALLRALGVSEEKIKEAMDGKA